MLRVTVELFPFGKVKDSKILDTLLIWNDGSKLGRDKQDYEAVFEKNQKRVKVKDHNRSQEVWALVKSVIENVDKNSNEFKDLLDVLNEYKEA